MKSIILQLITIYQKGEPFYKQIYKTVFLTERVCRFSPTCSVYAYQAVEKYGSIKGSALALRRFARCHPFTKVGYDPVP